MAAVAQQLRQLTEAVNGVSGVNIRRNLPDGQGIDAKFFHIVAQLQQCRAVFQQDSRLLLIRGIGQGRQQSLAHNGVHILLQLFK